MYWVTQTKFKGVMGNTIIFSLIALICVVAILDWYKGVWLILLTGFLQDPIRKVALDQPSYYVVFVVVIFTAVVFSMFVRGYSFRLSLIPGWKGNISQSMAGFLILIIFQLFNAYFYFGNILIVGLGAINYIVPIFAVFTGYYFACIAKISGLMVFFRFYSSICVIFTSGIFLQYFGVQSLLLGEVGSGLTIYDLGTILEAYSGYFRSSEVAAWHIFMSISIIMIMLLRTENNLYRAVWVAILIVLITAGLLTGRRKLVVTILIFGTSYWILSLIYLKQAFKMAVILTIIGVVSVFTIVKYQSVTGEDNLAYGLYVERTSSVFSAITERADFGVEAVTSAVEKFGLFGHGAGSFSQGARFVMDHNDPIGSKMKTVWETEGGFGRIVVELGLIGLVMVLWLLVLLFMYFRISILYLAQKDPKSTQICLGLLSILIANLFHFLVASQVFGDPFVLILLGLLTGIAFSFSTIVFMQENRSNTVPTQVGT